MEEYAIGVDLGGTNYRAAAIDRSGRMLAKVAGNTYDGDRELTTADSVITALVDAICELRTVQGDSRLVGVGIGVPGFILMEKGLIIGSNNLPFFDNYPVRDEIERRLGAPVILENDANVAALGEKWIGAGRGVNDLVLLTLGTGVGGGIISDGRILHGYLGMAAELGHITVVPNGIPCGCGNCGCLEKHASATAIVNMGRMLSLGDHITAQDVFEFAEEGNTKAKMVFESMGEALGIALANLVNIFNFPLYLISGGPLPAWKHFAPRMFEECHRRSFTFRHAVTRIEKAILGSEAGLYGAAYLPIQRQFPLD